LARIRVKWSEMLMITSGCSVVSSMADLPSRSPPSRFLFFKGCHPGLAGGQGAWLDPCLEATE
jgi:hypothetical protein